VAVGHHLTGYTETLPKRGYRRARVHCTCGSMGTIGFVPPPNYPYESTWIQREAEESVELHATQPTDPVYQDRWDIP